VSTIKEHYEYEINKLQATEKRLREEISNKQADLETLRAKLQTFEQSEASLKKKERETASENDKLNRALQNEKQKNDDLGKKMLQELEEKSKEIEQKNKKIQEIEPQYVSLKNYAVKLEAHYKTKKDEFAEEMRQNVEDRTRFEFEIRTLREELACYKEKANTLQFENKQLAIQKDVVQRKLLMDQSLADSQFQASKASRDSILSTPFLQSTIKKENRIQAIDDSNVKYNSAHAHVTQNQEDYWRRASIDSFSRGHCGGSLGNQSINVGSYQNMPAINRFNAISENDCEGPTINHKSLEMSDSTNAMRRISQLQTRNKQVPRHLQSSYALEDATQIVDENFVRNMDTTFNKENHRVRRLFWL